MVAPPFGRHYATTRYRKALRRVLAPRVLQVIADGEMLVQTLGRWLAALDDFRNWLIREAA